MKNKTELGNIIKNKRLQLNLRMDDIAEKIGVTRSTLWSIENGSGNYSIDTLFKLLEFLQLDLDICSSDSDAKRVRASRANSVLDKKINRFVIMCVEQYASSVNQSSDCVYAQLKAKGVINELVDDYEDMHGMSTYWINEYINKRLYGGTL